MPFVVFLLYLALTYIRPYELDPDLGRYRLMLVVGGLGLLITVALLPLSRFTFRARQLPLIALFAIWAPFTLVVAVHWFGGALQALNELGITLMAFVLAIFSLNSERRLRIALGWLVILSLVLVVQDLLALHLGIFQEKFFFEQVVAGGATVLRARATGFMTDPNDLAQSLLMAIPFASLAWRRNGILGNIFLVIFPISLLLYGIYLTGSRGAVLTLLVVIFVALRPKLGTFFSGLAFGLGLIGALALTFAGRAIGADTSMVNRIEAWSEGLQLLKQHPLFGVGYGLFTDYFPLTAHNSFVLCFAELGLIGYFLWVALLLVTVLELNAIQKIPVKTESDVMLRRIARSIQIALYSFLVSSWFLSRTYIVTLYLLIAFAIAVAEICRRSDRPPFLPRFATIATWTASFMVLSIFIIYLQIRIQIR